MEISKLIQIKTTSYDQRRRYLGWHQGRKFIVSSKVKSNKFNVYTLFLKLSHRMGVSLKRVPPPTLLVTFSYLFYGIELISGQNNRNVFLRTIVLFDHRQSTGLDLDCPLIPSTNKYLINITSVKVLCSSCGTRICHQPKK